MNIPLVFSQRKTFTDTRLFRRPVWALCIIIRPGQRTHLYFNGPAEPEHHDRVEQLEHHVQDRVYQLQLSLDEEAPEQHVVVQHVDHGRHVVRDYVDQHGQPENEPVHVLQTVQDDRVQRFQFADRHRAHGYLVVDPAHHYSHARH